MQLHLITIPNIAKNCLSLLYRAGEILFSLAWAEMEYIGSDKTELANECMKKLGRPHNSRTKQLCLFRINSDVEIFLRWKTLKGPKHEIFIAGIFTQINSVWIGDLRTRPKKSKKCMCGTLHDPLFPEDFVLALSATSHLKKIYELGQKKIFF